MGAKDWMLFYSEGDVRSVLKAAPPIDRAATRSLVERLYPEHRLTEIGDGTLGRNANPADAYVYAGCFPGLSIVCTGDVALDRPSKLDQRFLDEAKGRTLYLHAMHSVVDYLAFAVWTGDGELWRSLGLSPDHGIHENIGVPFTFEAPYWAGERPVEPDPDWEDEEPYPLPFHPLELAEDVLRAWFGFVREGQPFDDDPDLYRITLAGFLVTAV
ncbi:hypothetical protein AB0M46_16865 [Dactylosporangium sp. NPDC051485]|uniref:DUF6928 family protein n=1 Tax=Dactylosporangium sp. NPDC051485 TaxID=3154846 RepID=UPI00342A165C